MNYAKRPSSMLEQGWTCKTVLTIDVVVVVDVDVEKFPVHIGRGQIVRVNYLSDHTHDKAIRKWQPSKLICTHPPHHVQIQKGKNQASKKVSKQASKQAHSICRRWRFATIDMRRAGDKQSAWVTPSWIPRLEVVNIRRILKLKNSEMKSEIEVTTT